MAADGEETEKRSRRSAIKSNISFNNYPIWKLKDRAYYCISKKKAPPHAYLDQLKNKDGHMHLRENCCKRVRADRNRLLWKTRIPELKDQSFKREELIKSSFQDIVSDELKKMKETPMKSCSETLSADAETSDDMIWEYDGLHEAYQGEYEEILLEMQKIFYEDLENEQIGKDSYINAWEDEEDEYLARAVFENMQLNDDKVGKEVWCPMCNQGELQQNLHLIFCSLCELKLSRGDEVTLEIMRDRLAEAHGQHFDRGCILKPKFCIKSKFDMTALYMECQGCNTFEIVI